MKVDVLKKDGKKSGSIDLPDDVFAVEVKEALLWEMVKAQRASRRRGTHSTKTRDEVSGGGIKPFRQKGTGRARQGSSRSPINVGGGVVMGPHPRDYSYRLPRTGRRSALRSALSARAKDGLVILEDMKMEAPRTKDIVALLAALKTTSALIVDTKNGILGKSANNIRKAKYLAAEAINVYDILDHATLVITKEAVEQVVNKAKKLPAKSAASAA